MNLLAVCGSCNTDVKGGFDPLTARGTNYEDCTFSILHPYFNWDSSHHLVGGYDPTGVEPSPIQALSNLGKATVEKLGLDDPGLLELWLQEWRAEQWTITRESLPAQVVLELDAALEELSGRV